MKHVRIATYEIKKGSFQELADVAQDGMLREFRNQPGKKGSHLGGFPSFVRALIRHVPLSPERPDRVHRPGGG
jgi:hypothetical protein